MQTCRSIIFRRCYGFQEKLIYVNIFVFTFLQQSRLCVFNEFIVRIIRNAHRLIFIICTCVHVADDKYVLSALHQRFRTELVMTTCYTMHYGILLKVFKIIFYLIATSFCWFYCYYFNSIIFVSLITIQGLM